MLFYVLNFFDTAWYKSKCNLFIFMKPRFLRKKKSYSVKIYEILQYGLALLLLQCKVSLATSHLAITKSFLLTPICQHPQKLFVYMEAHTLHLNLLTFQCFLMQEQFYLRKLHQLLQTHPRCHHFRVSFPRPWHFWTFGLRGRRNLYAVFSLIAEKQFAIPPLEV